MTEQEAIPLCIHSVPMDTRCPSCPKKRIEGPPRPPAPPERPPDTTKPHPYNPLE
jgi:hypothetical protein